jgi:hypothetical protein
MKTIYRTSLFLTGILLAVGVSAAKFVPPGIIPIHIVFSAKAYWDGPTKSCLPRDKGGCCHIWIEGMEPGPGEIIGELILIKGNIFQLTVSKVKGIKAETYNSNFSNGKFNLDGTMTFDPNILSKFGIDTKYFVPPGIYSVTTNGDMLTIIFK